MPISSSEVQNNTKAHIINQYPSSVKQIHDITKFTCRLRDGSSQNLYALIFIFIFFPS